MSEENVTAEEATEQPAEQTEEKPQGDTTDWKSQARKWEALAKKGKAAEEELEALKQAQMSEQEKANARAEKAEAELEAMKTETARLEAARRLAAETNVPVELLEYCADEAAMVDFARIYNAKQTPVHSAPTARASKVVSGGESQVTSGDLFAQTAEKFFK